MNQLSSLVSLALLVFASLAFVGCASEEAPPEKQGETTSNINLPDLSSLGEGEGEGAGGSDDMLAGLQEQIQAQQDAMNQASQNEKGRGDALREILDNLK